MASRVLVQTLRTSRMGQRSLVKRGRAWSFLALPCLVCLVSPCFCLLLCLCPVLLLCLYPVSPCHGHVYLLCLLYCFVLSLSCLLVDVDGGWSIIVVNRHRTRLLGLEARLVSPRFGFVCCLVSSDVFYLILTSLVLSFLVLSCLVSWYRRRRTWWVVPTPICSPALAEGSGIFPLTPP
jgi:hypothetical protein